MKDLAYPDGTLREHMFINIEHIKSSIETPTVHWRSKNKLMEHPQCGKL